MLTLAKHPTMKVPKKRNPHSLKQTQNTSRSCFWLRWCSECTLEDSKRPNPNCSNYNAPTSFILPQLGAHGALKIIKQLSFQFVLSLTLHQIIPPLHPSPPAVCGPRAFFVRSIHGGARGEELLQDGGVAGDSRVVQRCRTSGAEGLGDVNGWRAPPRGSPPPNPGCSGRNCNL